MILLASFLGVLGLVALGSFVGRHLRRRHDPHRYCSVCEAERRAALPRLYVVRDKPLDISEAQRRPR